LHTYGEPVPEGFVPLTVEVGLPEYLVQGDPAAPVPKPFRVEGLDEQFYVYEGAVRLVIPVSFLTEDIDLVVPIKVSYQICSDVECWPPANWSFEIPVAAKGLTPPS